MKSKRQQSKGYGSPERRTARGAAKSPGKDGQVFDLDHGKAEENDEIAGKRNIFAGMLERDATAAGRHERAFALKPLKKRVHFGFGGAVFAADRIDA